MSISGSSLRVLLSVTAAGATLAVGGCGEPSDEAQVRSVAKKAADAIAARDVNKFCDLLADAHFAEWEETYGKKADCKELKREQIQEPSEEELRDARTFEVASVEINGDEAISKVKTANDAKEDAYFVQEDGEWKLMGSNALE